MDVPYRTIDSLGDTVEFYFREQRDLAAAMRSSPRFSNRHGRPDRVVIDGSPTNREAIVSCDTTHRLKGGYRKNEAKPVIIRTSKYLINWIEQGHRRTKRCIRPMLGFKTQKAADTILSGIELVHNMMRKRLARFAYNPAPTLADQFAVLAATRSMKAPVIFAANKNLRQNVVATIQTTVDTCFQNDCLVGSIDLFLNRSPRLG